MADGQTLWLHDVDLNQVAARQQAEVLGNTPAALIASAPDLKALSQFLMDTLMALPGVDNVRSSVCLDRIKSSGALPLPG